MCNTPPNINYKQCLFSCFTHYKWLHMRISDCNYLHFNWGKFIGPYWKGYVDWMKHVDWSMLTGSCWLEHPGWSMSTAACWLEHVDLIMLTVSCWLEHVYRSMLTWLCWLCHADWSMLTRACSLAYADCISLHVDWSKFIGIYYLWRVDKQIASAAGNITNSF